MLSQNSNAVISEVKKLMKQNTALSAVYSDVYYLYGSDKKLLVDVGRTKNTDDKEVVYGVSVSNFGYKDKILQEQIILRNLYKFIDMNYQPYSGQMGHYVARDAADFVRYAQENQMSQQTFLENLIVDLVDAGCPMDLIKRKIYCFNNVKDKYEFPSQFTTLNAGNKLFEYITPRRHFYSFAGTNFSVPFTDVDKDTLKVFDKLESMLQNQR